MSVFVIDPNMHAMDCCGWHGIGSRVARTANSMQTAVDVSVAPLQPSMLEGRHGDRSGQNMWAARANTGARANGCLGLGR